MFDSWQNNSFYFWNWEPPKLHKLKNGSFSWQKRHNMSGFDYTVNRERIILCFFFQVYVTVTRTDRVNRLIFSYISLKQNFSRNVSLLGVIICPKLKLTLDDFFSKLFANVKSNYKKKIGIWTLISHSWLPKYSNTI